MKFGELASLSPAKKHDDAARLLARLVIGAFLVWGVWDNVASAARMEEFETFLARHHFPAPHLLAPVSVYAQLSVGLAFIAGFATRWAGVICATNFVVALVMVDRLAGVRGAFPSVALILIGLLMMTGGAGRFSLDGWLARRLR